MNVKFLIKETTLRAILESHIGETIIGEAEQFFPCSGSDDRQDMIEFFVSDIFNEQDMMSILISKTDGYHEMVSAGEVVKRQKYILAKKSLRFRREGRKYL